MNDIAHSEPEAPAPPRAFVPPPPPPGVARKVRIAHLHEMKAAGRPVVMMTAYDATFARLADEGNCDIILVGDSVGNVLHGHETTLPVTMDEMVRHTQWVARGARRPLLVADMPFMSYQADAAEALRNAGRLVKEGGAEAVKLETSSPRLLPVIEAIVDSGIPVMGHVGLVPQSINRLSGYRVQGRAEDDAELLLELARALEAAGVFSIVLEAVPRALARRISAALRIPAIGIGAGVECDGQVLVMHDLLGLTPKPAKFVRRYADLQAATLRAFRKWGRDVREKTYPGDAESYE